MPTERQIAANKLNAQKSTGPKTPEGKAKSSLNHFSHGFASSSTLAPNEDPKEFALLLADLTIEYKPVSLTEQILVEKMAHHQWLSLRAFRLQTEAFHFQVDTTEIPTTLGLLIRYHTSADRGFHKAHNELVKTQKQRRNSEIGFEPQTAWCPPEPSTAEPPKSLKPLFDITCDYKIQPDFTYQTPEKAAKAAIFAKAA